MTSVRRSQAERSAATREALLDAAIACLIEEGYASTTTSRVAVRAGVSRGAHLHHFQTRTALVAAAVEQLARRWLGELLARGRHGAAGRAGAHARRLDLLWAHYASPLYQGALDLWTDARNDDELRERLIEVERLLDRETLEVARRLFPERSRTPRVRGARPARRRDRARARRCSTRFTRTASATGSSGPTAGCGVAEQFSLYGVVVDSVNVSVLL